MKSQIKPRLKSLNFIRKRLIQKTYAMFDTVLHTERYMLFINEIVSNVCVKRYS